jgi:hypothetical protein
MFYILLCFYLWIYGTLNKISYHISHHCVPNTVIEIITVVCKDDLRKETSVCRCNVDWNECLIDHSTTAFAAFLFKSLVVKQFNTDQEARQTFLTIACFVQVC